MLYFLIVFAQFCRILIAGIGLQLTYSTAGITFLGFPAVMSVTAYTMAILERYGYNPWLAFAASLLAAVAVGFIFAGIYNRISEDSFVVICLSSIFAVEAFAGSWDSVTNGVLGLSGIQRPGFFTDIAGLTVFTAIMAAILVVCAWLIYQSSLGRVLRAMKNDQLALQSIGISTRKVSAGMIVLSSILCGITADFYIWQVQFLEPSFGGLELLLEILTVAILALRPKVIYAVIGTAFVTIAPEFLRVLSLPSTILGYLRTLLYAISLIVLICLLKNRLIVKKRTI